MGKRSVFFLSLFVLVSSAFSTQIKPMNVEELISSASLIFLGKVVSKKTYYGDITNFEVIEVLKGQNVGSTYEVKQIKIANKPAVTFSVGETSVVFLYGKSSRGFSSPVGFEQGKFAVQIKEKINESVLSQSAFQKKHLWNKLSTSTLKLLKSKSIKTSDTMSLSDLKNLISNQGK